MNKFVLWVLVSSFALSGWTQEDEGDRAAKAEAERLCKIYTVKVQKYKETMREDKLSYATLANYERLKTKYCLASAPDKNDSK